MTTTKINKLGGLGSLAGTHKKLLVKTDHSFLYYIQVITVSQIKSLSQRWMEQPGAKAEVCVESLGEVGQLCEDHLRIILQYGDTTLTLLLPIWVISELSLNDC